MSILQSAVNWAWHKVYGENEISSDVQAYAPTQLKNLDGEKFHGGLGPIDIFNIDYWSIRQRSSALFEENLYARGLIRRLITNEINTGLTPEAAPDEQIIGLPEDSLSDWTETVENRFGIFAKNKELCDWKKNSTFGALQRQARLEALVAGDVLVVLRQSQKTKLPMVQLVRGDKVRTPLGVTVRKGHEIKHGVEFDAVGRVAAHWVSQNDGTSKRIPAFGEKSGRKISWLLYGTEKRLDDVRGQPLLAIVIQSLKEIDRYRDSVQRKAVVNSILAMFIEKNDDKISTLPLQGAAVKRDSVTTGSEEKRNYEIADQIPGLVLQELQKGEKPVGFNNQGTDQAFGPFEDAIIQAIAWVNQIPPELLKLSFSSNYAASQAAINEFKIYQDMIWDDFGDNFCAPIYSEWLISEALQQKISAPKLLESWRDPLKQDVVGAWLRTDWYGSVKIASDKFKQVRASKESILLGLSTHAKESRITNGSKWSHNMKRLKRENQIKAEAMRPILELEKEFGTQESTKALDNIETQLMELVADKE